MKQQFEKNGKEITVYGYTIKEVMQKKRHIKSSDKDWH